MVPDILYQINVYMFKGRYTRADTQQSIYSGNTIADIYFPTYSCRYATAETHWHIQDVGYTEQHTRYSGS
jgi:hypothetical protein